jgi:hypothetical protein
MSGNLVANSDESIKKNWRNVSDNFVEKLAQIKSGVYERTDLDITQAGVSAQSLQTLLPETVTKGTDGLLGVAPVKNRYGRADRTGNTAYWLQFNPEYMFVADLEESR